MGFFNYYLSLGLCLAAIALSWRLTPPRMIAGPTLLVIAYSAHKMPVLWVAAVVAYVYVSLSAALAPITQGARVINGLYSSAGRLPLLLHNIDGACISRFFGYASYEPASRAVLVNVYGDNKLVLHDPRTFDEVHLGSLL
jgi:hypothetical protein